MKYSKAIAELEEEIRKFKIQSNFFKESYMRTKKTIERLSTDTGETFKGSTSFVELDNDLRRYKTWCEIERNENNVLEEKMKRLQNIMEDMYVDQKRLEEGYLDSYNDMAAKEHQHIDELRKYNIQLIDDLEKENTVMAGFIEDLSLCEYISKGPIGRKDMDVDIPATVLGEKTMDSDNEKTISECQEQLKLLEMECDLLKKSYEEEKRISNKISRDAEKAFKKSALYIEMEQNLKKYKEEYELLHHKNNTLAEEGNEIQKRIEDIYCNNQELINRHQVYYCIGMTKELQCIDQLEKENLRLSAKLKKTKDTIMDLKDEINKYNLYP